MNKISIVIPVYNASQFIEKCINSVLVQSYKNFELLLFNDGSKDNSLEILMSYKNKYPELIKVYDQKNMGVSKTRNKAIELATGKYLMFIDNDDFIDPDYLHNYILALDKDYDIVLGGYRRINDKNQILFEKVLDSNSWSKFTIVAPWAKLYKREFLINNNFVFLDSNIGEDIYFNIPAIVRSKSVKIIEYVGYNWYYNESSISNTIHKKVTKDLQFEYLLDSLYAKLNDEERKLEEIEYFFIKTVVWYLLYSSKKTSKEILIKEYKEMFNWLKKHFPTFINNHLIRFSKPKGEELKNRWITKFIIVLHKINLVSLALSIYRRI